MYDMTNSELALGVVSAGAGLFIILFALYGGVIADRVDKRNLLIVTQFLAGIATLIIALLITADAIAFWHLVVASIFNGLILAFRLPVRQAIIPELVEKHQVMNAVALNSGAMNMNRVIAPALGGVLVAVIGIDVVYYLMTACYFISGFLMFKVPSIGEPAQNEERSFNREISEAVQYVRRSPELLGLLLMAIIPIVFGMPYQMLMSAFAEDVYDVGSWGLGLLMAAVGVGALAGSFIMASLGDYKYKGKLLLVAAALFGIFLAFFAISGNFHISLIILVIVGGASSSYMAVNTTLLMMNCEENMRGRIMSMYMMTIGLFPLGVLPAGAIAEYTGVTLPVLVGGVIIVVFTLVMAWLTSTLRRL